MTDTERGLLEAVFTLDPMTIRIVGNKCGHPVRLMDDFEVLHAAAEMVVFAIPNAPREIRDKATNILAIFGMNWVY